MKLKARLHDATKACDHATCDVRQNRTMKRAYCDMRLSQESWMISTFLRQHATVACRTNKPVYTAQFCRMSHQFCRIVHVNAPSEWACILLYDILTFYSIPIFILRHSNSATRSNWFVLCLSVVCRCVCRCVCRHTARGDGRIFNMIVINIFSSDFRHFPLHYITVACSIRPNQAFTDRSGTCFTEHFSLGQVLAVLNCNNINIPRFS